jgi:hypothetical protein
MIIKAIDYCKYRTFRLLVFILLILTSCTAPGLGSPLVGLRGDIPLNEDNYRGIYSAVNALQSRGFLRDIDYNDYPVSVPELAESLGSIDAGHLDRYALKAYRYLQYRLRPESKAGLSVGIDGYASISDDSTGEFHWGLFPRVEYKCGHLFFTSRYTVEDNLVDDHRYQGKKWNGFSGYGTSVYGSFRTDRLRVVVGRSRYNWGPGKSGSLILSGCSMPFDGLNAAYSLRENLQVSSFTFILDPYRDISGRYQERYLSGHRIIFSPRSGLVLGLSEVIIYGGEGRNPELYYAFPLFFLHGAQLNQGRDDNTLIEMDFRSFPGLAFEFYGQILIDDFQIEKKTRADNEPSEYGITIGVYKTGMLGYFDARLEYVRISNRTYNQPDPRNRYLNRGYPIGHPLGNDGDLWLAEVDCRMSGRLVCGLDYTHRRKGEGRIETAWDDSWMDVDEYEEDFPAGTVETTDEIRVSAEYLIHPDFRSSAGIWFGRVDNVNNRDGIEDDYFGIEIELGIIF